MMNQLLDDPIEKSVEEGGASIQKEKRDEEGTTMREDLLEAEGLDMTGISMTIGIVESEASEEPHRALLFRIDDSHDADMLHWTREINLCYDIEDEQWTGDAIVTDGWVDLDPGDAYESAERFGLAHVMERHDRDWADEIYDEIDESLA